VGRWLVEAYEDALTYRQDTSAWGHGVDEVDWYQHSIAEIARRVLVFEHWRTGVPCDPLGFVRWKGALYTDLADAALNSHVLGATRAWVHRTAPLFPYMGHPRERLARVAMALVHRHVLGGDTERELRSLLGLPKGAPLSDSNLRKALLVLRDGA
jgi:hypothetical protein